MPTLEPLHPKSNSDHVAFLTSAKGVAMELAKDEAFVNESQEVIRKDGENKLSVGKLHFTLESTLSGIGMEKVQSWAVPGSVEGFVGDNVAYDYYKYKDTDGNIKTASWWNHVRDALPFIASHRAILKRLNDDKDMHDDDKAKEKRISQNAITAFNGRFRDAVALFFKMQEANDEFAEKGVLTVTYAERVVMVNGKPKMEKGKVVTERDEDRVDCILVTDLVSKKVKSFTIPNFLRLNVKAAIAKGGTFGDFIKSNARAGETPTAAISIEKVEDFESGSYSMLNYLNAVYSDAARQRMLIAYYDGAGSDERLKALVNLRDTIDKVLTVKSIKARVDAYTS